MNWTLMFRLRSLGTKPYNAGVVVCVAIHAPMLIWWLFLQLSPSPSINFTFQQEDPTVVKKFQHILGLCSSSQQRKLENRYHASNLCMKLEFFIGQKYTLLLNC